MKLKKILVFFSLLFLFLVFLGALGFGILYFYFPPEKLKPYFVEKLNEKLALFVEVGEIQYSLFGAIKLKNIALYEKPKGALENPLFFRALETQIYFDFWPLLKRQIVVHEISLSKASLYLRKTKEGYNWEKLFTFKKNQSGKEELSTKANWEIINKLPILTFKDTTINFNEKKVLDISFFKIYGDIQKTYVELNLKEGLTFEANFPLGYEREKLTLWKNLKENPMGEGKIVFKNFRSSLFAKWFPWLEGTCFFQGREGLWQIRLVNLRTKEPKFSIPLDIKQGEIFIKNPQHFWGENFKLIIGEKSEVENLSFSYSGDFKKLQVQGKIYFQDIPPLKEKFPSSGFQGEFSYSPEAYSAKGELFNFSYSLWGKEILAKTNLPLFVEKNQITIPPTTIWFLDQKLAISFALERKTSLWQIRYNLTGENVNLEEVFSKIKDLTKEVKKGAPKEESKISQEKLPLMVSGKVHIKRVHYKALDAKDLKGALALENEVLSINPISFSFSQGDFLGSYRLNLAKLEHEFSFKFQNVKPNDLLEKLKPKMRWFATLNGSLEASFMGKENQDWQNSLKGSFRIETGKGRLLNTDWQLALISAFLTPLEDRLSAIEYEKAQLYILAEGGKWYFKKAHFSGYDITFDVLGFLDWEAEGEMNVQLRFKESFIRDLANPLFLGIEEQRQGEWYYLPFSCQGKVSEKSCWQKDF